jgi:hypothetical protein
MRLNAQETRRVRKHRTRVGLREAQPLQQSEKDFGVISASVSPAAGA